MIEIPRKTLIIFCGIAGCGKSTFAAENFMATEIVSSDNCRAMISDSEENMEVSRKAFELFHFIIEKRMETGRLVVADSTALSYDARKRLLQLARRHGYYTVLVIFDVDVEVALMRNSSRERNVSEDVIRKQHHVFEKAIRYIDSEGYDLIIRMDDHMDYKFSYRIL